MNSMSGQNLTQNLQWRSQGLSYKLHFNTSPESSYTEGAQHRNQILNKDLKLITCQHGDYGEVHTQNFTDQLSLSSCTSEDHDSSALNSSCSTTTASLGRSPCPSRTSFSTQCSRKSLGSLQFSVCEPFSRLLATKNTHSTSLTLPSGVINKVFCSEWINDSQVLLGTKSHQLFLYDLQENCFARLPCPYKYECPCPPECTGGVHFIRLNPSGTHVATNSVHCSNFVIYSLPDLVPLVICSGPANRVFDACWLSDTQLLTASRDGRIYYYDLSGYMLPAINSGLCNCSNSVCLCHISSQVCKFDSSEHNLYEQTNSILGHYNDPSNVRDNIPFLLRNPLWSMSCGELAARSLCWDGDRTVYVLNSNSLVCSLNVAREEQNWKGYLPCCGDTCCMDYSSQYRLLAVGGPKGIFFIDPRESKTLAMMVELPEDSSFVRSLLYHESFISVGTGTGELLFMDLRFSSRGNFAFYTSYFESPLLDLNFDQSNPPDTKALFGHDEEVDVLRSGRQTWEEKAALYDINLSNESSKKAASNSLYGRCFFKANRWDYAPVNLCCLFDSVPNRDEIIALPYDLQRAANLYSPSVTNSFYWQKMCKTGPSDTAAIVQIFRMSVFTHCYHPRKPLIFVGGGTLSAFGKHNFASLFYA